MHYMQVVRSNNHCITKTTSKYFHNKHSVSLMFSCVRFFPPLHFIQTSDQEELSQLLPSQWGMVHLFDLCLRFGHADTASALAMRGVPGCFLEDHHNLGPFSSRDYWDFARLCDCQDSQRMRRGVCRRCCWAFPVDQSLWMEDWDADLFGVDWVHRPFGAIPAAQKAAATPVTCTMLDLCSQDMDLPFSGSPKAMARLLDIAILTGNQKAAVKLSQKCQLWPLRRWVMGWDLEECWKAARTALWAGANFQDLMVKYDEEHIPFPQALFLKSFEDWQKIRHLLPRCHGLWRPRNLNNNLGELFLERPHGPGGSLKLSLGKIRAAEDAGVDVRFFFVKVWCRDESYWPAFVTLLDVAIWCGQPDWAEACVDGGIELKDDDRPLAWHKGILRVRSWARNMTIIVSGRHSGEIHVVPSEAKIAATAASRAWLKRLWKRECPNICILLHQMFKGRLSLVEHVLKFTVITPPVPKIIDQLDLWAHVEDWTTTICGRLLRWVASGRGGLDGRGQEPSLLHVIGHIF